MPITQSNIIPECLAILYITLSFLSSISQDSPFQLLSSTAQTTLKSPTGSLKKPPLTPWDTQIQMGEDLGYI